MNFSFLPKLEVSELVEIIDAAKKVEPTRDLKLMRQNFSDIWEDIEKDPVFESFILPYQAELYRYAGFFLSHYGKMKNLMDYQERGKKLLTKAIELFFENKLPDRAREAQIMLALCYYYEGAVDESIIFLDEIIEKYEKNQLHPVFLQAVINKAMVLSWKGRKVDNQYAEKILDSIRDSIELLEDWHLLSMYHNHCGMVSRSLKKEVKSIYHYTEAIKYSKRVGNLLFEGANYNNLANVLRQVGKYGEAHKKVDDAIKIFLEANVPGWLAQAIDTKANIFFDDGKDLDALLTIDKAIKVFERGEDAAALCEALMTKTRILIRLRQIPQAISAFLMLSKIAEERVCREVYQKYAAEFKGYFYVKKGLPLADEIKNFRKEEITEALRKAKNNKSKASRLLGMKNPQNLDEILQSNPDISLENGLPVSEKQTKVKKPKKLGVKRVRIDSATANFDDLFFPLDPDAPVYYLPENIMHKINKKFDFDALVVLKRIEKIGIGQLVLAKRQFNSEFYAGIINFEHDLLLYSLIEKNNPIPLFLTDLRIVGELVGFCSYEDAQGAEIVFKPFE